MSSVNLTNFDAAIKQTWPQKRLNNVLESKYPLAAKIAKETNFMGSTANLALQYGNSNGNSATFGNAQANMSGLSLVRFAYTRAKEYGLFSVDGETVATAVKPDAIIDASDTAIKSCMDAVHRRIGVAVYGDGLGTIATVTSGSSMASATITITDVTQMVNFQVGQVLQTATAGVLNTGTVTVASLNREGGTITVSEASWNAGIPSAAASDTIHTDGDFNLRIKGLDSWLRPTGSSTPGTLFGVNRNTDVVLLAGQYYDASSTTIEDGLIKISQLVAVYGGTVSDVFMNPADLVKLSYSLGSRVRLDEKAMVKWGFSSMSIVTAAGVFGVHGDPFCPLNRAYALQLDTWKLRSAGAFPRFLNHAGTDKIQLEVSADAITGRVGGYYQMICDAPAWNGVVKLA